MPPKLIGIGRAELAVRTAVENFPALHPVTHAFDLMGFRGAVEAEVDQMFVREAAAQRSVDKRNKLRGRSKADHTNYVDEVLYATALQPRRVGDKVVHILPLHRHLVRHGALCKRVLTELSPAHLVLPTGECDLYQSITRDAFLSQYRKRQFATRQDFLRGEAELMRHCLQTPGLQDVVNRRLLLRPTPAVMEGEGEEEALFASGYMAEGLEGLQKNAFSFENLYLNHYPFFYAVWEARLRGVAVHWEGVPPLLFEERARHKTFASEWERNVLLENHLIAQGRPGEWLQSYVQMKQERLTPEELVSDTNMRVVAKAIQQLAVKPGRNKVLLVVPLADLHHAVGWLGAVDSLTTTSVNECLDESLDLVPSFSKAPKAPEFLEIERAMHMDTEASVATSSTEVDTLTLSQDPRLAHPAGAVNNPMVLERLRPSSAVRVLQVDSENPIESRSFVQRCEITDEAYHSMKLNQL